MIYLHTGAPGAGKTLSAVEFIETILSERPDRVVYTNINGMSYPGVVVVDHDWMRNWWDTATPGCLIVIDEAQQLWRASRGGDIPKAVTDLETHRHDGIDIVMITQHPTLVHANIRKLVTRHVHVVEYTKKSALRWEWREAHDDVQDNALRAGGEFKEWFYPARLYSYYISAADHSKRTKRPRAQVKARIFMGIAISILVLFVIAGFHYVPGLLEKARQVTQAKLPASVSGKAYPRSIAGGPATPITTKDYVAQQIPRVPSQPWSAPLYDGQAVTQHPRVFCAELLDEQGRVKKDCRCITEQGTHYVMDDALCQQLAEQGGAYDPYMPDRKDQQSPPSQSAYSVPGAATGADAGRVIADAQGSFHGAGAGHDYVPPELLPRESPSTWKPGASN